MKLSAIYEAKRREMVYTLTVSDMDLVGSHGPIVGQTKLVSEKLYQLAVLACELEELARRVGGHSAPQIVSQPDRVDCHTEGETA